MSSLLGEQQNKPSAPNGSGPSTTASGASKAFGEGSNAQAFGEGSNAGPVAGPFDDNAVKADTTINQNATAVPGVPDDAANDSLTRYTLDNLVTLSSDDDFPELSYNDFDMADCHLMSGSPSPAKHSVASATLNAEPSAKHEGIKGFL